jgi:hypothetical protein
MEELSFFTGENVFPQELWLIVNLPGSFVLNCDNFITGEHQEDLRRTWRLCWATGRREDRVPWRLARGGEAATPRTLSSRWCSSGWLPVRRRAPVCSTTRRASIRLQRLVTFWNSLHIHFLFPELKDLIHKSACMFRNATCATHVICRLHNFHFIQFTLQKFKVDRYSCRQVGCCEPENLLDLLVPKWWRCDLATEEKRGAWHNSTTRKHANLHFRCFFEILHGFLVKKLSN